MKSEILSASCIFFDIAAKDKPEILGFLGKQLLNEGKISSLNDFLKDVYWREAQGETGIEHGLAIPHGKSETVLQTSLCFARLNQPIEWETLDGESVSIVILFAVPSAHKDATELHIKLLAKVAGNLVKDGVLDLLKITKDKEQVVELLLA